MIYMMRLVESAGQSVYNVFPMRNKVIPGYIRLDTKALVQLLLTPKHTTKLGVSKTDFYYDIVGHKDLIWCALFKTNLKCFAGRRHQKYVFGHQIQTDGIAVSILWKDKDESRSPPHQQDDYLESYIDAVPSDSLRGKKLVGIDPNKGDLIYCASLDYGAGADIDCIVSDVDGENAQYLKTFRYTQNQRRYETKTKIFAKRNDNLKKNHKINGGKTVKEIEAVQPQNFSFGYFFTLFKKEVSSLWSIGNPLRTRSLQKDQMAYFY